MSERKVLKRRNKEVYPITHEDCILDSGARPMSNKYQSKDDSTSISTEVDALDSKVGDTSQLSSTSCIDTINAIEGRYDEIINSLVNILTESELPLDSNELDDILTQVLTYTNSPYPEGVNLVQLGFLATAPVHTCMEKIGSKVYVMGGYTTTYVRTNYCYDLDADTVTTMTTVPATRYLADSCICGDFIYLIGGYTTVALKTNYRYDPTANSWSTMTAMPNALHSHCCDCVNDKIYVHSSNEYNDIYMYDPTTNAWTTITNSAVGTYYNRTSQVYNDKIYIFGGYSQKLAHCYDPSSSTWTTLTSMSGIKEYASSVLIDDDIYIIGGSTNSTGLTGEAKIYKYNISSNSYETVTPLFDGMVNHSSVPYNDKCFIIQYGQNLYVHILD